MFSAFLITLREGLEAALIIGIILAYLARSDNRQAFKQVWLGTGLAVVASLIAGAVIFVVAGEFSGRAEEIFEGIAMFLAAGVLTWMIFWMRKQAVGIRGHVQDQVQSALAAGSSFGLLALTFIVVVREGVETALFLFATTRVEESAALSAAGGILGLAVAIVIGYGLYRGASRLNLRMFFNVTSLLLIVFAAGLLAHGIHEFQEVGIIPTVVEHVWDINNILSENSGVGEFLKAIAGYNGNPSVIEVIGYGVYLATVLTLYLRPSAARRKVGVEAGV